MKDHELWSCDTVGTNHDTPMSLKCRLNRDRLSTDLNVVIKLCEQGLLVDAFRALQYLDQNIPDSVWGCFLQGCIEKKDLEMGRKAYACTDLKGLQWNSYIGSYFIRLFDQCGSLMEANEVFDNLKRHNCYTWSAIISAHVNHGKPDAGIELYVQMQHSGRTPDGHIFVAILKACVICKGLTLGMVVHSHIIENGLEDTVIGNALIDMYGKCGNVNDGRTVYDKILKQDKVTWNAMIGGYSQNGFGLDALCLFQRMWHQSIQPDTVTLVNILKACSTDQTFHQGKCIHNNVLESGVFSNMYIGSALIDMYCKNRCLSYARRVFDSLSVKNLVVWNAMITGYVQQGCNTEAFELYQKLIEDGNSPPDSVTFLSVLKACSNFANVTNGKSVHTSIMICGFELEASIGNTLIDMYSKCGNLQEAHHVFEKLSVRDHVTWNAMISAYAQQCYYQMALYLFMKMKQAGKKPDIVTWNALIAGYAQHGHGEEAIELFCFMEEDGMKPDNLTFASVLKACSSITALDQGRLFHSYAIESDQMDEFVECATIDMYTKCGSCEDAHKEFRSLSKGDVVTWNAMMAGYALHDEYALALNFYKEMQQQGVKPDYVTSISLLSMCSRLGLIEAACQHIQLMTSDCEHFPVLGHYNCIIDILGRSGCLSEATDLLQAMPFSYNILHWTSLLTNCRTYGNVKLGKRCFKEVMAFDENYGSAYVMMSNLYADSYADRG